jgi:GNAT superfamily N-acetyltransferase
MSITTPSRKKTDADANNRLSLNERLALIGLINSEARNPHSPAPVVADLFDNLWNLVDRTVSGARVDHIKPDGRSNGFKVLEITSREGESLGRLNMLYLRKPLPCYYLVYVEVAKPFRNKGLGTLVLEAFKGFLIEKSAIGVLDNIIPRDDPTFDIYLKLDWQPLDALAPGLNNESDSERYMVFLPPSLAAKDLETPLVKLIHHLRRKRPAIEMRDNEFMVRRTIEEFKDLYQALLVFFEDSLASDSADPVMRYMFTRYVTKLLGFGRRIRRLVGYTGGESLSQIILDARVRDLVVQSYAPKALSQDPTFFSGDKEAWLCLPEALKSNPARFIEGLPNYQRPTLISWLKDTNRLAEQPFTIGDLLDIGFDPTRLKEFTWNGEHFIFERVQAKMLPLVEKKRQILAKLHEETRGLVINGAKIETNPPLLIIRDRGNAYVLRRKLAGIHWEEAKEQLEIEANLQQLNALLSVDRVITKSIKATAQWVDSRLNQDEEGVMDPSNYFVSWNLESNTPVLNVHVAGTVSAQTIWIA